MTLTNNPIANMPGPAFLLFYWLLSISTLILFWLLLRFRDKSMKSPVPPLSSDPNPYKIGYVRGGLNEVLRLGILSLLQRRYITETESFFAPRPNPPSRHHLTSLELEILAIVSETKSVEELFSHPQLESRLEPFCERYKEFAEQQELVHEDSHERFASQLKAIGIWLFCGLGLYKIAIAFSRFKFNIVFLVLSIILLYFTTKFVIKASRLTRKGAEWIEQWKTAHASLSETVSKRRKSDPSIMLAASIFGLSILGETHFAEYMLMFRASTRGSSFSSSGCGSSCGSGCGSCGSGCGGCGGGCGGCGGCG